MTRETPFFLSEDPRPEEVQDPDDPRPEEVQDPDDPRPEEVQDPDDPRPEEVQDPDDPHIRRALKLLRCCLADPCCCGGRRHHRGPRECEHAEFPAEHNGFVVVRLSSHLDLSKADDATDLGEAAETLELPGLQRVLEQYDMARSSSRLVDILEVVVDFPRQCRCKGKCRCERHPTLHELERAAVTSELPPLHSLAAYWRIDVRAQPVNTEAAPGDRRVDGWEPSYLQTVEAIVGELNELEDVDRAYRELAVSDPLAIEPSDDPYSGSQEYLERAPLGIDARWAWGQANDDEAEVGLVDLEQGWILDHEDLQGRALTLLYGDNRHRVGNYRGHHGTAVLGEIVADDNDVGIVGIAPAVRSVGLVSHYDAGLGASLNVANAIRQAIPKMNRGDVLLLEVQRSYLPTEIDDADLDAIRLAVAHGIIVVEAAGNGNANLDCYVDEGGARILRRRDAAFRESGAIMVGAARADLPHDRFAGRVGVGSNHGSRIDCFGFGNRVVTTGYGNLGAQLDEPDEDEDALARCAYTHDFGGTSAAAPIIAGAALVVQGMYQERTGSRLSPWEMRRILSDPSTGTRQGHRVRGHIGVMPDLRAILRNRLGLVPDLYLRDHIGDPGRVPAARRVSASPDIIVVAGNIEDPSAAFGDGYVGGGKCDKAQDHSIYLRARNRGREPARQATATVYWSEVATLVTPAMWHPIAATASSAKRQEVEVPAGDLSVLSGPITWCAKEIEQALLIWPGEADQDRAHFCFTAILDDPRDEQPVLPPTEWPYFDWEEFRGLLRQHNNIATRNFHLVGEAPGAEESVDFPFLITGTPDLARVFELEIIQHLPSEARLKLEAPLPLASRLHRHRLWETERVPGRTGARLHLPAQPSIRVPGLRLAANARFACRFRVFGDGVSKGHTVAIRHLYRGEEVGRITWQFR